MKKRINKQKRTNIYLHELLLEAYDEINSRGEDIEQLSQELDYYKGFIEYHKLESLFSYFRKNAHKEDYQDLPFDHYTL